MQAAVRAKALANPMPDGGPKGAGLLLADQAHPAQAPCEDAIGCNEYSIL